MTKSEFKAELLKLFGDKLIDIRVHVAEDGTISFQGVVKK